GAAARQAQANRPAPVLHHDREVGETELINEALEHRAVLGWREPVAGRGARHAVAGVVRRDAAELVAEACDDLSVQKRPGRIAVQGRDRLAGSLVNVVEAGAAEIGEPMLGREQLSGHGERDHYASGARGSPAGAPRTGSAPVRRGPPLNLGGSASRRSRLPRT